MKRERNTPSARPALHASASLRTAKGALATWLPGACVLALLAACGGGTEDAVATGTPPVATPTPPPPADTTAPSVTATSPVDASVGVALNEIVTVTFNEAIDGSTVTDGTFSLRQGATVVPASVTTDGTVATLRPRVPLRSSLPYTAKLSAGVEDLAGNPLGVDVTWQFTIAAYNVAFVTSVRGQGNLGAWRDAAGATGIDAGDAICRARAEAAGLPSPARFRAGLSDHDDDAYCRIHDLTGKRAANCGEATLPASAGPWVRTDGFPFGASLTWMTASGEVYTPLRVDEFASPAHGFNFTGSTSTGALRVLQFQSGLVEGTCENWTSSTVFAAFVSGTELTTVGWSSWQSSGCVQSWRLVCMHAGAGPALPAITMGGKKAFVTSTHRPSRATPSPASCAASKTEFHN